MQKIRSIHLILVFTAIVPAIFMPLAPALLQSSVSIRSSGKIIQNVILYSSTSPSPSLQGQTITFKGYCTDGQGVPLPQQSVLIQYSKDTRQWSSLVTQTDSTGNYTTRWTPSSAGRYYIKATAANAVVNYEQIVANSIVYSMADLRKAAGTGGVVFVAEGTYNTDSTIYLSSNLLLIGSGKRTIINVPEPRDLSILFGANVRNVQVTRLLLNGNRPPNTSSGNPGILFVNSSNISLDSITIVNLDREAFGITYSSNIGIINSTAQNVWNGVIIRDSSNILVKSNSFDWIAGDGIYISTTTSGVGNRNITLEMNVLRNIGDTGIDVSTPYQGTSVSVKIYNNLYLGFNDFCPTSDHNGIGITLSKCNNAVVSANNILSSKGGLLVGKEVVNASIDHNTISGFSTYGVWVVTPTDLSHNTISNGEATGIRINGNAGNFTITQNLVSNTSIAIEWVGPAPSISILNNTILNSRIYGIFDGGNLNNYWTSRSTIVGNSIRDTRTKQMMQYGVYQGNSAVTWTIGSNLISGTVVQPMYLASKTNVIY